MNMEPKQFIDRVLMEYASSMLFVIVTFLLPFKFVELIAIVVLVLVWGALVTEAWSRYKKSKAL